jgi:HNH endonuclease
LGVRKDRICNECGCEFHGETLRCRSCRRSQSRACVQCGKEFRGETRACNSCRGLARSCARCGHGYSGLDRLCSRCSMSMRTCVGCGSEFFGKGRTCSTCLRTERSCITCGRVFVGAYRSCLSCRRNGPPRSFVCRFCSTPTGSTMTICAACLDGLRLCGSCGRSFIEDGHDECGSCRSRTRICQACGVAFPGWADLCTECRPYRERTCVTCGRQFSGTGKQCSPCYRRSSPIEMRSARDRQGNNVRRARILSAQICGSVPTYIYRLVLNSGPCVYCGMEADTVDHVRALARGGWEHESNLVPACRSCNVRKKDRLLTELKGGQWSAKVAHAVAISETVRREWERLTTEVVH